MDPDSELQDYSLHVMDMLRGDSTIDAHALVCDTSFMSLQFFQPCDIIWNLDMLLPCHSNAMLGIIHTFTLHNLKTKRRQ